MYFVIIDNASTISFIYVDVFHHCYTWSNTLKLSIQLRCLVFKLYRQF